MRRFLAALSLLTLFTACGGDGSTDPTTASIAGTYTLRTVNGSPMPYTVTQSGPYKYEITSDAYTLSDGGTWSEIRTYRTTSNEVVTTSTNPDGGTYSRNGTAITLVSPNSGAVSGSVANGTMTLTAEGFALVFVK